MRAVTAMNAAAAAAAAPATVQPLAARRAERSCSRSQLTALWPALLALCQPFVAQQQQNAHGRVANAALYLTSSSRAITPPTQLVVALHSTTGGDPSFTPQPWSAHQRGGVM